MLFKLWKRKGGKKFTFSKRGVAGKTTVENDKVGNTQRRGTPRRGNGGEGRREGAPEKSGARVWERERKKDPRAEWGREMRERWPFGRLSRARAYPAMIHGGVPLPRHDPRRGPRQPTLATSAMQMPRGRVYPATMHGGVLCFCPAMHGGGVKRPSFEIFFESVSKLKFVSYLG
jgi:hypothetical protein